MVAFLKKLELIACPEALAEDLPRQLGHEITSFKVFVQ
jgi:hypothetical protein